MIHRNYTFCVLRIFLDKRLILTGYFSIDVAVNQTKNVAQVLALWHRL